MAVTALLLSLLLYCCCCFCCCCFCCSYCCSCCCSCCCCIVVVVVIVVVAAAAVVDFVDGLTCYNVLHSKCSSFSSHVAHFNSFHSNDRLSCFIFFDGNNLDLSPKGSRTEK